MVDAHHLSKILFNGAYESILCDAFGTYCNDADRRRFDLLSMHIASVWQYDSHVPRPPDTLRSSSKYYLFYHISEKQRDDVCQKDAV